MQTLDFSKKEAVEHACDWIRQREDSVPSVGIILGTGMGGLASKIGHRRTLPYDDIPGFLRTTVSSHKGELVFGEIGNRNIVAMEGRFHYYEGHPIERIAFPVRVMRSLGAKTLIVSAACGGMNPQYEKADLVLIEDHINLMGVNPLIGPNDERIGPRFPDMCAPYDREILKLADRVALKQSIRTHRGVYVAVAGPNLETRAEYRFLRTIGADVVGMSVVPEAIAGVHCGLRVFGIAIVTDMCLPDALQPAHLDEIIATSQGAEPRMTKLLEELIPQLPC